MAIPGGIQAIIIQDIITAGTGLITMTPGGDTHTTQATGMDTIVDIGMVTGTDIMTDITDIMVHLTTQMYTTIIHMMEQITITVQEPVRQQMAVPEV